MAEEEQGVPALAPCKRERGVKCMPSSCGPSPLSLTRMPPPPPDPRHLPHPSPSPCVLFWPRLPCLGVEGTDDISFQMEPLKCYQSRCWVEAESLTCGWGQRTRSIFPGGWGRGGERWVTMVARAEEARRAGDRQLSPVLPGDGKSPGWRVRTLLRPWPCQQHAVDPAQGPALGPVSSAL